MEEKLKYLCIWCVALVAALWGCIYLLAPVVLESYRAVIESELTEALGAPVTYSKATIGIARTLKIVLFDVAIKRALDGVEIEGPRVSVRVELLPLLARDLHVKKIELHRPTITLVVGNKASPNLEAAVDVPATGMLGNAAEQADAQQRNAPSPFRGINRISIEDGRLQLRYQDGTELAIVEHVSIESRLISKNNVLSLTPSTATLVVHTGIKEKAPMSAVVTLQRLSYVPLSRELAFEEARIQHGASRATLSGSVRLDTGDFSTTGSLEDLDLDIIGHLLGLKGLQGTGNIHAQVTRQDGRFMITGDLSTTGVRTLEGEIVAERIGLNNLEAEQNNGSGEVAYRGTLSVQNASVQTQSGESYAVSALSGDIQYRRNRDKTSTVQSGKLTVGDFSFTDAGIVIKNVSGEIQNTKGTIKPNEPIDFTLNVNGKSIELATDAFSIKRIAAFSAPLSVSVLPTGEYSIKGPVKAEGGQMLFHQRQLAHVRGDVDMLIASNGLRFASKNLYAESLAQPIQVQGSLLVSPLRYDASDLTARVAGGSVSGNASMQRGSQTATIISMRAHDVRVDDFLSLIYGRAVATLGGVVNSFSTDATADKDNFLATLKGKGQLEVSDGTLKKVRFRREVVDLIEAIPAVGAAVSFTTDATDSNTYAIQGGALKGFSCDFSLKDAAVTTNNLKASGKYSNVEIQGKLFFDGRLDAQASAVYLEQNIKALGGPIKPLGRLMGNIGRIEIPLLVQGTIDTPTISADFSRLHEVSMPGRAVGSLLSGIEGVVRGK